jgi:flagellar biosynthesis chaperone FliJ
MPRRFVFKLQSVLDQRQRAEDDAKIVLARAEQERLGLETELRGIQRQIDDARSAVRAGLSGRPALAGAADGPVGIAGARAAAADMLHLNLRAQRTALELAGSIRRCESARAALTRAMAARRALELLREKAREEYRQSLLRAEAAALDELTVMRHGRTDDATLAAFADSAQGTNA